MKQRFNPLYRELFVWSLKIFFCGFLVDLPLVNILPCVV